MEVEILGISLSLTWLLALITLAVIVIFLMYDSRCHTYWKHRGIPFEPPRPIFGNMKTFAKAGGLIEAFELLQKRHGKVYGLFFSRNPVLVVGDPDIIRHITVKAFNNFHNRMTVPQVTGELMSMVSSIEGERWREVRNILTPAFSGSKMKQMSPLINNSADSLVKYIGIKQKEKGYVECQEVFGSFVMDTVGSCAFGLDIDSQSDPSNPFVINAKRAFQFPFEKPLFILGSLIPPLGRLLANLRITMLVPADVIDFFKDINKKMINMRKSGTSPDRYDFLQSLIDAQKQETVDMVTEPEEDDENDVHADLDKHHDVQYYARKLAKKAPLTDAEVFGQTLIFFTAGAETTTTLLGFIFYALSRHPEVQEKLIDEIDKVTPSRDSVGYTSVASMPYLDQVVCETLRLYPPAAINDRVCNETFEYNGMVIEKGVQVFIPTYTIQHDPEYWPEPEKFDPGRFAKEERAKQHPFAWMPFGAGPRNCIGMRFALMEAKMAVVRVLQNYRFETCAQTEIPPKYAKTGFLTPPNGITLKAIPRTDLVA